MSDAEPGPDAHPDHAAHPHHPDHPQHSEDPQRSEHPGQVRRVPGDADPVTALRRVCTGPVHDPHGVDAFVELVGRRRDGLVRRVAVVGAVEADDVARTLRWAAAHDVVVAVPGSGHVGTDARPTVVVTRSRIDAIVVDPRAARLHAGVGATWSAVRAAASAYGLGADVPDLPLPLADAHTAAFLGVLSAAPVRALTLVTGDGVVHHVDRASEPDLWWTLGRGSDLAGVLTGVDLVLDTGPRPRRTGRRAGAAASLPQLDSGWSAADRARLSAIARRHDPVGVLHAHATGHA
jgi:hypothetical protein